jgi:uncharacterized small protein (DUF1192 family)
MRYFPPAEESAMALDPFLDEKPKLVPLVHQIGQDLSTFSVAELDERIEVLEREIERLQEARARKEASKAAADAFFRS